MFEQQSTPYERAVAKITDFVKPNLHKITHDFVGRAIEKYAPDNERFAKIIAFEVRRRGDGAGLTQDVSEPLLWAGIKTAAALSIAAFTHHLQNKKFRLVGDATALGIMLNNAVEVFRLIPRYKAGLQGSLEMAKDRWESIQKTGVDPFRSQTRELNTEKNDDGLSEHASSNHFLRDPNSMGWEARAMADKAEKQNAPQAQI